VQYNPIGESRLREIFLKTDNLIEGRYLAELTQGTQSAQGITRCEEPTLRAEVFEDLQQSKYQMAEYRISIYGRCVACEPAIRLLQVETRPAPSTSGTSWPAGSSATSSSPTTSGGSSNSPASMTSTRRPAPSPHLRRSSAVRRPWPYFSQMMMTRRTDIFQPLFEVTQDPTTHPELHVFLQRVIGFDSVDDESKAEKRCVVHALHSARRLTIAQAVPQVSISE
jgi:AMP deaminase